MIEKVRPQVQAAEIELFQQNWKCFANEKNFVELKFKNLLTSSSLLVLIGLSFVGLPCK